MRAGALFPISVPESNFHQRQHIRIVLLAAFKVYEIVISATGRGGKLAAGTGSRMIDSALARFLVQKHAGLAKHLIGTAAKNSFLAPCFGEARACHFRSYAKVRRQSSYVSRCHLNAIVDRATVRNAFIAIVILWFLANNRC